MKPHKHAELIKAWADGAKIQYKVGKTWFDAEGDPRWADITEYRIKPEPKPDVIKIVDITYFETLDTLKFGQWQSELYKNNNLKLIFDGETGALKDCEILK